MTIKRILCAAVIAPLLLQGCADSVSSTEVNDALNRTLVAETQNRNIAALPIGKGLVGVFSHAGQFVIATKVGNIPGSPNCGLFDVIVTRPAGFISFFRGKSDFSREERMRLCI